MCHKPGRPLGPKHQIGYSRDRTKRARNPAVHFHMQRAVCTKKCRMFLWVPHKQHVLPKISPHRTYNPARSAQQNAKRTIISHVLFPDPSLRPGSDVPSYHIIYPFADSLLLPAFFSRKATHSLPSRFRGIFFWRCVTTSESETAQKLILVSAGRPGRGEAGQCQWFELPRIADR